MHKIIRDRVISTYAGSTEYSLRGKLAEIVNQDIIESKCDKIKHEQYCVPFIETNEPLDTPATREINYQFLQTKFQAIPDEVKQMMDITELVSELGQYQVSSTSSFGRDAGKVSFEYRPTFDDIGDIIIGFNWHQRDEFGVLERSDKELNIIHGVILYNHKYYAITHRFMAWLQEPDKPKRAAFLAELFY